MKANNFTETTVNKMKVLYMGTPDFAVKPLEALIYNNYEVVGVFTQPDKPVGRKAILTPPPVKVVALDNNIPVFQPDSLKNGVGVEIFANKTAKQSPVSALSSIHAREVCIYIQDNVESILKKYNWEANTARNREEIKTLVDTFLSNVKDGDGVYDFKTVMDATNNTTEVIDRNMGVIGFTLFFAFFSVIGINFVAFCLALALDSGIKGQKIFRTIFFLPNVLSMIIVALIWSMLFVQLLPAVTGIEQWISDSAKTPWLLVLVAVWQGCGYYMIVYLAGLQNIPVDVIEAAKIDGATGWQRFRYVTLPLMIPSLTISLFLSIANALKSFDLIYAMIGSTGYATGTVPFVMDIYFDAFSLKQAGLATAKAMVLFVVIVLVTGIQLFTMKRKEVEA